MKMRDDFLMNVSDKYSLDKFFQISKKKGNRLLFLFLICYILWGLFGLIHSPGFSYDEGSIVDPAINFAHKGYLAIPSLGPGFGHKEAFCYQAPLHLISLGVVYKVFGVGVWQGRLFSLALSVVVLLLVYRTMLPFGPLTAIVAVILLAVDPKFTYRAREIRYDWLALIGVVGAFKILQIRNIYGGARAYLKFLLVGIFVGFAANSHVLYFLYSLVFGLIILFPFDSDTKIKGRVINLSLFGVGLFISLVPYMIYIFNHYESFLEQFVYQANRGSQHNFNVSHMLLGEIQKYITYYKYSPFLLLLYICSLIVGVLLLYWFYREGGKASRSTQYCHFKQLLFIGLLMPVVLACASGHHSHHHLMIAPFWAMLAASVIYFYRTIKVKFFWPKFFVILLLLGVGNGLLVNWGIRTYTAIESWGTRDISTMAPTIKKHIPQGASVYGDYHLIFIAWEEDWRFVQEQGLVRRDEKLLSQIPYDYLVYRGKMAGPGGLDMSNFEKVADVQAPESPFSLPHLNSRNERLKLTIYARKSAATGKTVR